MVRRRRPERTDSITVPAVSDQFGTVSEATRSCLTGRVRRYCQFFRLAFCVGNDSRLRQLSILASERAVDLAMYGASRLVFNAYLLQVNR